MTWELREEMLAKWISLSCPKPNPEGLWNHEWKKHGTCTWMDRLTYFETAVALHHDYNILEAFHLEGIYPNGQMYDLLDLHQVLGNYIGEEALITCSFNDFYQVSQIYEVFICLDKSQFLPLPCPTAATFKTNCRTPTAMFPEFNPPGGPTSCPVHPPSDHVHTPVRYCTDPALLPPDELNPIYEEKLDFHLDSIDSELASDEDEYQDFLRRNELERDEELDFF
ncbi:hypothetical protein M758_8G001400 [Ceratodon purpureus]|nr:hypothetical protein M758_8G001400 [Ceratodon purpureus]